jgi:hypothetical protein
MHARPGLACVVAVACALLAPLAACGGDDDDGASIDAAGIDATPPDAMPDRCIALCACAVQYCGELRPADFPDEATCMTDCAALPEATKACRVEHCGYAMTNPSFHCPHVAGDPDDPSPMCVAP